MVIPYRTQKTKKWGDLLSIVSFRFSSTSLVKILTELPPLSTKSCLFNLLIYLIIVEKDLSIYILCFSDINVFISHNYGTNVKKYIKSIVDNLIKLKVLYSENLEYFEYNEEKRFDKKINRQYLYNSINNKINLKYFIKRGRLIYG